MKLKQALETNNLLDAFHQEMGKLIFYFDQDVESVVYDTKEKYIYYVLIKKIVSNATAANILIYEGRLNEAKIVLRSAIETVILITYLSQFPNKIEDYIDEAQIIKIKNNFIVLKSNKEGEPIDEYGNTCTREFLVEENKRCFNEINKRAQNKILSTLKLKEFVITDENFNIFDKYFSDFRPKFMKFDKMLKELDRVDYKVEDSFNYTLKDIVYCFYNESSQVAHSCFLDWHYKPKLNEREKKFLFSFFIKVTLFLQIALKGTLDFRTEASKAHEADMKQAPLNLERIVFGHTLNH